MNQDVDWYSNTTATFGDRVAAARDAVSLSQADLARKLGVKLATVRNWENDLSEPRANKLQMLSGMLGVSLMWLLNGEGDGVDAPIESKGLEKDILSLLAELRDVQSDVDRAAERLARTEKRLRAVLVEAGS
ncbi:MAG: helix-turn-helix domain-containing protein [Pseudomonadota bacterium]